MIRKLDLGPPECAAPLPHRTAGRRGPAQVWLTDDIANFGDIWPRSLQIGHARCFAFQCADLLEIHCRTIARARSIEPLFVAVVDAEGSPLLLLPLGIERRHGTRVLGFLDGGNSDYNSPVLFPATREWGQDEARLIWKRLGEVLPPVDIAVFEKMPHQVGDLPNPLVLLATRPHPESGHAMTLSGTWAEFAAKRLPHRQDSRRQRRRLEERGSLIFEIAETPEQYNSFLDALIRQKTRRHLDTLGTAEFDQAGNRDFVTETTRSLCVPSPIHLSSLKLNDTIIASHWGYVIGSRFYYLIPSFEGGEWARFSAGRLLLEKLLEWSFSHGIEIFDFGIGDEYYKSEYCDLTIVLHGALIPMTIKGRVYAQALKLKYLLRETMVWQPLNSLAKRIKAMKRLWTKSKH